MNNLKKQLKDKIRETREELYQLISETGIVDDPKFKEINSKLDELILQWYQNGK